MKGENFLEILGILYVKFEQFSSKILRSWLNFWGNFFKKFVQISGEFLGMNATKILRKYLRDFR